ncbi:alkaline phosphatase family protein [uncultured Psychroserpens sp.]|uniref:alkaline phosphatase family protein n=1 Tax=uncultured Psychroserpens sp. TaxID=255436 RepID=UPI002634D676|nr:alkaline phosphatase family protein [uncultured Psychroserpens sp.]
MGVHIATDKCLKKFLFIISIIAFGCSKSEQSSQKIIIIHSRGIPYTSLITYLDSVESNGFFKQKYNEGLIKKLTPITNAVTISNIATFETGEFPNVHGIIGHSFAVKTDSSHKKVNGFSLPFGSQTFIESANNDDKKILNLGALVFHHNNDNNNNTHCIAQGKKINGSSFLQLTPYQKNSDTTIIKYNTLKENSKFSSNDHRLDSLFVYMISKKTNTNELIIDNDYNFNNGIIGKLRKENWLEVETKNANALNESFRFKWLECSSDTLQLYVRGTYKNRGYPYDFLKLIDENVSTSKGWPNISLYSDSKITDLTLIDEINTETDFIMNSFSFSAKNNNYDLIVIDYPLIDRYNHAFLQLKKSSTKTKQQYANAYKRMDEDFKKIENYAKKNNYELIITSGHGFSPVHTSIDIDNLLISHKINIDKTSNDWKVMVVPGKVSAHVYINPELDDVKKRRLLKQIKAVFENLYHPEHKMYVIDDIYEKSELDKINLDHENSGDLFVLLKPGFVFEKQKIKENTIFGTPTFKGEHGYALKHDDSFGILISNEQCNPCLSSDIANIVTQKLKLTNK